MPLYDYKCPNGHIFDDFNTIAKREKAKCPECGRIAKKLLNTASIDYYNMGVSDSFPTALQKWEKMHRKEAQRRES